MQTATGDARFFGCRGKSRFHRSKHYHGELPCCHIAAVALSVLWLAGQDKFIGYDPLRAGNVGMQVACVEQMIRIIISVWELGNLIERRLMYLIRGCRESAVDVRVEARDKVGLTGPGLRQAMLGVQSGSFTWESPTRCCIYAPKYKSKFEIFFLTR